MDKILPNGAASNGAHFSAPAPLDAATFADLAARLGLTKRDGDTWRGANPFTGEGSDKRDSDRFVLFPEGNGAERNGPKYTRREVFERAGMMLDAPTKPAPKPKASAFQFDWHRAQTFDYVDEGGALLFQVGRIGNGAEKEIRQRRPDSAGGWAYALGAGFYEPATRDGDPAWYECKPPKKPKAGAREFSEVRRVLYRLPDVLRAQIVFLPEGEKAADALNAALESAGLFGSHVATTNAQGAGKWRDEMAAALDGKTVCVLPDFDKSGDEHGAAVCASIYGRGGAAKVVRLDLPDLPAKGDVYDWLSAGGTVERLLELLDKAPKWTAQSGAFGEATSITAPSLRTERGAPEYDARQLVELLNPDWTAAALSTQVAMSLRARDALSDVLRYVPALGWLWFDGRKWTLDDKAATGASARVSELSGRVREEAAALLDFAATLAKDGRTGDAEAMTRAAGAHLRHARQVETRGFIEGALHFAAGQTALRASVEAFDARPFVLGFQNGVWDKGDFRAHRREDFLLHLCPVAFDESADRRQWEAVLERITGGDWAFARTLQDVAGYVLSGAPHQRVLPWLYGPKGTGKSTFAELLQTVLGEQSTQIEMKDLDGSDARERLGAKLWNRRLAVFSEAGNKKLDAELLKTLSGGDRLPVRHLYKEAFNALPRHVLAMVSNDPPRLDANDGALKDRVMALPFEHRLDDGQPLDLTDGEGNPLARIEAAREDPISPLVVGFTAWAGDGLARVHRFESIERAPCIETATAKFWSDTDTLTPFWASLDGAQLDALNGQGLPKGDLRKIYEGWCEEEGARPVGSRSWFKACEGHGLEESRQGANRDRFWRFKTKRKP
jgi:P4 family phage/plasmid primase-like protien